MQYQVFKRETNELVAWIDSETNEHIVHKDYNLKIGDNLTVIETEVEESNMKKVAKFEKVSKEQYKKDFEVTPNMMHSNNPELALNWCYDNLQLPVRKTKGSAGYDFITPCDLVILPHSEATIRTGIKCQIEEGYVLELYPRSSLGFKYRLALNNTVGIIDSDYYNNVNNEGHIQCKMYNPTDKTITIPKGEAYMQGIFKEFFLADEEEVTAERVGGIGSTNS